MMQAIVTFGRFNPPTAGHAKIVTVMRTLAGDRADLFLFPSVSEDHTRNPLRYREKVTLLRQCFPSVQVVENRQIRTPLDALYALSLAGYQSVIMVVGDDRAAEFERFGQYVTKVTVEEERAVRRVTRQRQTLLTELAHAKDSPARAKIRTQLDELTIPTLPPGVIRLAQYIVHPVVRPVNAISASRLRTYAQRGEWDRFRRGAPRVRRSLIARLFHRTRAGLKLSRMALPMAPRSFLLLGSTTAHAQCLRTAVKDLCPLVEEKLPPAVSGHAISLDVSDASYASLCHVYESCERAGYQPTILLYAPSTKQPMTESRIHMATKIGMVRQNHRRAIVDVRSLSEAAAVADVRRYVTEVLDDDGKPRAPTEVDRLRDQQVRQTLQMKTRQGEELLAAQQRELARKAREKEIRIQNGRSTTHRMTTR